MQGMRLRNRSGTLTATSLQAAGLIAAKDEAMEELDREIVRQLRLKAVQGANPSRLLRDVIDQLSPLLPHKVTLIRYIREAFCLSLQQASPIGGWEADGSGELSDANLDAFVQVEIVKNRAE